MNIKSKIITFILCLATLFSFLQPTRVQAATNENYDIISECEVTAKQAKKWAKSKDATDTFIDLADLYWEYYSDHGDVNPGIAYVQAAKETGYGKFGGVLDESFYNPCGMKTSSGGDDNKQSSHERFNSWEEGVQAHLDHLALYAGAEGYPRSDTYDPRHYKTVFGSSTTTDELSGRWCPSSTYGSEVSALYTDLLVYSGLKSKPEEVTDPEIKKPTLPNAQSVNLATNNNVNISSNIGWKNYDGSWYYYKSDNSLATGWINPDGNWYYLNGSGLMLTGWIQYNGNWYYLNESGVMQTGWKSISGLWYYLQGDGSMVTGLRNINGKIYYLSSNGDMLTGNQTINNVIYYFDTDGSLNLDKSEGSKDNSNENPNSNPSQDNGKKVIAVDPGHARGADGGTLFNGYSETELDMQVALKLKSKLESLGYKVILTRTEDQKFSTTAESLYHRVDVANDNNADLFISIHHNAVDNIPTAKGVETYYSVHEREEKYGGGIDNSRVEKSKQIAKEICDNICNKINANNRGAKNDSSSAVGSLCVLKNTNMPAVLIETGFLTNTEEAERCADSYSQQLVADAIVEVIQRNI